jgi:hypothetical protein
MLHVITYSTSPEKVQFLMESASIHSVKVQNLSTTTEWKGFAERVATVKEFLRSLPPRDIVCFLDAYDVLVNATEEQILSTFQASNCELLFGAEIDLFPHSFKERISQYPSSPTPFRFLNAGVYVGYAEAILKLFSWKESIGTDDQGYCQEYILENPSSDLITLDHTCSLVLNMSKVP